MLKQVTFSGYDHGTGPHIFPLGDDIDRTIGHIKMARALPPQIESYIRCAKPIPGKTQLLIDAMGAGEFYGCFPAGTLVQTSHGEVPIEEITPGTMVLTHLNRYRPVKALLPQVADELCDLQVKGLPSNVPALTATPNHELWVILRDDFVAAKRRHIWKGDTSTPLKTRREAAMLEMPFSWVAISDLRNGDMIAEPFPRDEDPMALGDEKWNTPEIAFLMGLYAAEGCIARRYGRGDDNSPYKMIYSTGSHEAATHERVIECAKAIGHQVSPQPLKDNSTRLEICSKEMTELCLMHIGSLAVSKRLSQSILRMPIAWQKTFFRAYADGDGCVRGPGAKKEEGAIRCVSASAGLLRDFRLLLARQGIAASISGRHSAKATWYNGKPIYELMISTSQLGGRGCSKSYIHPDGYILSSVKKSKTYEWQGEVYDLSVEEDTSYVASGVSVHNSNVNGDHFSEEALSHKGRDYGYETFMHYAYPFRHHINKDPARAYGDKVTLSAYDDRMHRVLLIITVDDMKCRDILGDISDGNYADVSMGCKVPWDECSICHNRAKNRSEYCPHLRYQMNKILQDGRRVVAYNRLPKFFDISFVTIGAEKASHVLSKVAGGGRAQEVLSSAELGELHYGKEAQLKSAEIEKDIPSNPTANIQGATPEDKAKLVSFMDDSGEIKSQEKALPTEVLNQLGRQPLNEVFSTLSALGISLKPEEFQRIVLVKEGSIALADRLQQARLVFDERHATVKEASGWTRRLGVFSPSRVNEKIAMLVAPCMIARSCYPEPLLNRLTKMASTAGYDRESQWFPMSEEGRRKSSGFKGVGPMSIALATGFLVFRRAFPGLMAKSPTPVKLLSANPWLLPVLVGAGVGASVGMSGMNEPMPLTAHGHGTGLDAKNTGAYHMSKKASVMHTGTLPLAYIVAGSNQRQWHQQERIKVARDLVSMRPELYPAGILKESNKQTLEFMKVGFFAFDSAIIRTARRIVTKQGRPL